MGGQKNHKPHKRRRVKSMGPLLRMYAWETLELSLNPWGFHHKGTQERDLHVWLWDDQNTDVEVPGSVLGIDTSYKWKCNETTELGHSMGKKKVYCEYESATRLSLYLLGGERIARGIGGGGGGGELKAAMTSS